MELREKKKTWKTEVRSMEEEEEEEEQEEAALFSTINDGFGDVLVVLICII